MTNCHKTYPNCIWQISTEWHTLGFYSALLTKIYWNYATHIVRVCVTLMSPKTSKLNSLIIITFQSISILKPWLAYMNSYAIILSRLTILCLKNCFPICPLDFRPTFLIILHMKAPMRNQPDRSTPQSLNSTLTT